MQALRWGRSASVLPAQNFAITLNNKLHLFFLIISLRVITSRQAPGTRTQSSSDRTHSFIHSFIPRTIVVGLLQSSKYWIRCWRFQRETSPGSWPDTARVSRGRQLLAVKMQMLGSKCWEWKGKGLQPLPPGQPLSFPFLSAGDCNGPHQKSQIN